MTKTVTVVELFMAIQEVNTKIIQAAVCVKIDSDAESAKWQLIPLLWKCTAPIELNEAQTAVFDKYKQPVPKDG